MKKFSTNLKYLTLSLMIIIVGFTFASKADAWSAQYTSDCNDGTANGIVTSAYIVPSIGPFPVNSGEIMDAYAIVTTVCASETVAVKVSNNSGAEVDIVPSTVINSGVPIFSDTAHFAVPAAANIYNVRFRTGVDDGGTQPILVSLRSEEVHTPSIQSCNGNTGTYLDGAFGAAYIADFYANMSDYNNDIKLDVTGQNLKVKMHYYSNAGLYGGISVPTTDAYTAVLSGTSSYIYGDALGSNFITTSYYTPGNYVPSDCEYFWHGDIGSLTIYDGSGETVPYAVIPGASPTVSLNANPTSNYTGDDVNLSWSATGADSCTAYNFSTSGLYSGNQTVQVNGTQSYTLSCSNMVGTVSKTVVVEDLGVYNPTVSCNSYPGFQTLCPDPGICVADPSHFGFEICQL